MPSSKNLKENYFAKCLKSIDETNMSVGKQNSRKYFLDFLKM